MASCPVIWALGATTDLVVRILGGNPQADKEELRPEELRDLVADHCGLYPEQRLIISGGLEIHERRLRHVLVPRREVFALLAGMRADQVRTAMADSGRSRAPVVAGELDEYTGVVNLRDLMNR
jgi:putative hemolysin